MLGERLDVQISVERNTPTVGISVVRQIPNVNFSVDKGGYHLPYEGDYIVEPTFQQQVLQTLGKWMRDDVTVRQIKVFEASNPQGGKTVTIGTIGE